MKTKIDSVGRLGVPKKIRLLLQWEKETVLNIRVNRSTGELILKKAENACICCGGKEDLFLLKDEIYLCSSCAERKGR